MNGRTEVTTAVSRREGHRPRRPLAGAATGRRTGPVAGRAEQHRTVRPAPRGDGSQPGRAAPRGDGYQPGRAAPRGDGQPGRTAQRSGRRAARGGRPSAAGPRPLGAPRPPGTAPAALRGRPGGLRAPRPQAAPTAQRAPESRTHFVFLVVGLLGGGLLCLLLINTVLAAGSFRITSLQQGNVTLAQRERALQAQIAAEESPASLARRAHDLGMVMPPLMHFINIRTGRIASEPTRVPGIPAVPGYVP